MLQITVRTESGPDPVRMSAAELTALLARIGAEGDHFVVLERIPEAPAEFLQTWRDGTDGPYQVEYRDGSPDRHFATELTDPDEVAALFLSWARGEDAWRTARGWEPVDLHSTPGLDAETRATAEEAARRRIRTGFWTYEEVAQGVRDHFDPAERTVTADEARRIVLGPWQERLAEQETWPEVTDADRVARAFAALRAAGITARMNFSCCGRCGAGEIGAERAEGDHGFAFFHHQDAEAAAEGHGLDIRYGAHGDPGSEPDDARDAAVGQEIVKELTNAGLPVEWDWDPNRTIRVTPLDWRKRLPGSGEA